MTMLDGELTSLALCWRLERQDGAGIALTSHDEPLTIGETEFDPVPGMTPAAVSRALGLEPHSAEVAGGVSSAALSEEDLALGRWDGAAVRLTIADWTGADQQPLQLLAGELGSVNVSRDAFSAELQGAAAALNAPVCPATSAECRAEFGDKRCRVDLAGRTMRANVVECSGTMLTLDVAVDEQFVMGRLRFVNGANCGRSALIMSAGGNLLELREQPRGAVLGGCAVELREGCDKRFTTCVSRFENAVNFRGEPHLPGNDLLTRYPGA